jgi:hypothetical protein
MPLQCLGGEVFQLIAEFVYFVKVALRAIVVGMLANLCWYYTSPAPAVLRQGKYGG